MERHLWLELAMNHARVKLEFRRVVQMERDWHTWYVILPIREVHLSLHCFLETTGLRDQLRHIGLDYLLFVTRPLSFEVLLVHL